VGFKFGSDPEHVNAFRSIVKKAKDLDSAVDENLMTPDEAWTELQAFIGKHPVPQAPEHVKKLQAREKIVKDKEAKETGNMGADLQAATKKLEAAKENTVKVVADIKSTPADIAVAEKAQADAQRAVDAFTNTSLPDGVVKPETTGRPVHA
jgi:hypothetical protein